MFDCFYLLKGTYKKQVIIIINESLETMLVTITSPKTIQSHLSHFWNRFFIH